MNKQIPMLMESPLTKRVFVVTKYTERSDGLFEAKEKHDITKQFDALASLRAGSNEPAWIPASERLPETEDHVFVTCITKTGRRNVYLAYYMHGSWHGQMRTPVIAWMPLPTPYEG